MTAGADFEEFFRRHYEDVVRYAVRRTPDGAEDIAAEAFAVAWRRWDEVPAAAGEARAYLFGIARRLILAAHGDRARQGALAVRLTDPTVFEESVPGLESQAVALADLAAAWRLLRTQHQEVLAMAFLDDLTSEQAGRVLGISAIAYRVRLARARAALRVHLGHGPRREAEGEAQRASPRTSSMTIHPSVRPRSEPR